MVFPFLSLNTISVVDSESNGLNHSHIVAPTLIPAFDGRHHAKQLFDRHGSGLRRFFSVTKSEVCRISTLGTANTS